MKANVISIKSNIDCTVRNGAIYVPGYSAEVMVHMSKSGIESLVGQYGNPNTSYAAMMEAPRIGAFSHDVLLTSPVMNIAVCETSSGFVVRFPTAGLPANVPSLVADMIGGQVNEAGEIPLVPRTFQKLLNIWRRGRRDVTSNYNRILNGDHTVFADAS